MRPMQLLPRIELRRERADKVRVKIEWDDGSSALFRVPELGNLGKGPAANRDPPIGHGRHLRRATGSSDAIPYFISRWVFGYT